MQTPEEIQKKHPSLTLDEVKNTLVQFKLFAESSGKIRDTGVVSLFESIGQTCSIADARKHIGEFDDDHDGSLNIDEFLKIYEKSKTGGSSVLIKALHSSQNLIVQKGSGGAIHGYNQDEVSGFVEYLNSALEDDADLKGVIPIKSDDDSFFKRLGDGLLLCKMVNLATPDTIDERVIAKGKKLNQFSMGENITLALASAKGIGISVVNVGNTDIRDGTSHLILGLTWQLIRMSLVSGIQLNNCPELIRLLLPGETLADLLKLSPEQILLRWLNYHLKQAGSSRTATNFTTDLADSEIMTTVLNQLDSSCTKKPLTESDLTKRADLMLQEASKLGCRKFVTPQSIVRGNQKLNVAFVANLFNTKHGLQPLSEAELAGLNEALFASQGDRLERQFSLWMNSCGVEPFIVSLLDSLQDGLILLQMFEHISPGSVNWKTVHREKLNAYRCGENLNQAVEIGKRLGFSLVNIDGKNIYDKNKMLTLGLLWQMMRFDYLKIFTKLGGGSKIRDEQIVSWANDITSAKGITITGFKDEAISDSKPLLTLLDIIKPETVDWSIYIASGEEADKIKNAKYVISIIRKFGGTVYALPEDIVEHDPRLVMTVYASIMAIQQG